MHGSIPLRKQVLYHITIGKIKSWWTYLQVRYKIWVNKPFSTLVLNKWQEYVNATCPAWINLASIIITQKKKPKPNKWLSSTSCSWFFVTAGRQQKKKPESHWNYLAYHIICMSTWTLWYYFNFLRQS